MTDGELQQVLEDAWQQLPQMLDDAMQMVQGFDYDGFMQEASAYIERWMHGDWWIQCSDCTQKRHFCTQKSDYCQQKRHFCQREKGTVNEQRYNAPSTTPFLMQVARGKCLASLRNVGARLTAIGREPATMLPERPELATERVLRFRREYPLAKTKPALKRIL